MLYHLFQLNKYQQLMEEFTCWENKILNNNFKKWQKKWDWKSQHKKNNKKLDW